MIHIIIPVFYNSHFSTNSSFYAHADHCVHYYDLRNTKQPIMVFKGHRKAVSYAKFVNGEEIVSAYVYGMAKPYLSCIIIFKTLNKVCVGLL